MTSQATLDLESRLAELRSLVEPRLDALTQFPADCPERLKQAIRYSLLANAKRLRPVLVLMAAEAAGGQPEQALDAACAVEMIHTYSLIHDDLPAMDDDDLRRGRPTCHKVYGEGLAILAGDALLTLAFEVLVNGVVPAQRAAACCQRLARAAGPTALVGGQADDLQAENSQLGLTELKSIHARKTGAMFVASLELGGLAVGASDAALAALTHYGNWLGLLFQVTDDLLDVRGCEANLGKRVGKDCQRGKLTFPGLIGVEASEQMATAMATLAVDALHPLEPKAGDLRQLARYILERDR